MHIKIMIVLSVLTLSQWICINKGFWMYNIWMVTQYYWWGFISRNNVVWPIFLLMNVFIALKGTHFWILHSLDYTVNIKNVFKKLQNIISFRGVFAPTGHVYKPLIEKPRDHLDSDLFSLTRLEIWADYSRRQFCKFDFVNSTLYSFTREKNVTLTFQGHGL